ncbi:MAG: hypothetical protein HOU81_23095 [Hamadaea sp.]|uniref:hypothetical protein n=1 Tax=Hamadaea sp. TaxID=2024425 RepID=UPI001849F3F7|nr:hypothetical protein [Hamadaea sp.]NUR73712.1 hypothetical protein [Hamadaea sp.]NUT22562.1 hypothetical protein [Hamadaea sp.]
MGNYLSGQQLGARLEELVRAANAEMPVVQAAFNRVLGKVQYAHDNLSAAFTRPADFGGGGGDKHLSAISQIGDVIAGCVKEAEQNVELTAEALRLAAAEYARTDQAAGTELRNLMANDYTEDGSGRKVPIPDIKLAL